VRRRRYEVTRGWGQAVELVLSYERMGIALPQAAAKSFDEFMRIRHVDIPSTKT
jgi:hypothetical protein